MLLSQLLHVSLSMAPAMMEWQRLPHTQAETAFLHTVENGAHYLSRYHSSVPQESKRAVLCRRIVFENRT
jgi:hypothetical protein